MMEVKGGNKMQEPSLDEQLRRVTQEMHNAEDALITSGFTLEQWMLIKKYIGYAIVQNQIMALSTLSSFEPTKNP
jgi:hypothetical protein